MPHHPNLLRTLAVTSALCLPLVPALAQVAPPADSTTSTAQPPAAPTNPAAPAVTPVAAPANSASANNSVVTLSPFVVPAGDQEGYRAYSTLAGTRVRTDLRDVASSISVVTTQFLKDTGATDNEELLPYQPSSEVSGLRGNFTGQAGTAIFQENTTSTETRIRGLDAADNTRDYFITDIPWDSFNVDRIDLQRGPNSILFGVGSPAGIINYSPSDASFQTHYNVENRVDQYGTVRVSANLNQSLIDNVLAIRFAALNDNRRYEQDPAYNDSRRYYGAIRFDPKIFDEHSHTSIRVNYENGEVSSNNPRQLPPVDEITRWFGTGKDAYGNPGLNKLTINQFSLTNANPSGVAQPGATGSALSSATFELGGWAETRSYWGDVLNYYEATPTNYNASGAVPPSGTPIKTIVAEPNTGMSLNGNGSIGALTFRPMGIPPESQYAAYVGPVSLNGFNYPGGAIPGGAYYSDNVLTDPTIFNFYKKLLDGPNKHEWQNWNAFNVALDQSFFDNRLAFEFVVDQQHYTQGANQWLTGSNYAISVDVNQTYANDTANPNVGRPYVGNAESNTNYQTTTDRHNLRLTPTWEIRPEDYIDNPTIARLIGKQVFTGVIERNEVTTSNITFSEFDTTPDYILNNTLNTPGSPPNTGQLGSNREFDWIAYLGPSLSSASSAHNANLNNTNYVIAPPTNQTATNFNSTWNGGTVNPNAPFTYTNYTTGASVTGTQKDNPANYVGWTQETINWMRASNPSDFPSLVTSANRTVYRDDSKGITYQGYLLGGSLVPSLGLRSDHVTNYQSEAQTDPISGFTSLNYPDNIASRTDVSGTSRSGGLVYHLPEGWFSKLPWEPTISVEANDSENFKADATRLNLAGAPIPNATGKTKEAGFVITALHDKVTLKVDWFNTRVANATLADTNGNSIGGLGNNAYFIADGTIWGYGWATALQDGAQGRTPGTNYWDYANADGLPNSTPAQQAAYNNYNLNGGSFNGHSTPGEIAITNAWLHVPISDQFFASYALTPTIKPSKALATGNLRDAWAVAPNDANGPVTGAGSTFGNHQVTVDNLSRGTEIELTAEPIRGWDLTLNYAHVNATHENIDPSAVAFIGAMTKFMNGPGGQVREWFNGGQTLGSQWNSSIVAPFTVELNELGHAAPEVSPWRFNLVSTYNFSQRPLKGLFIGGGLRIEAGRIIGYHFDPNFKNANSNDPNYAGVTALTLGGLNVNEPFIGPNETHVDSWVGYKWRLSHGIDWRIQVNMTSVGEKDRLEAARIEPDGSIGLARIVPGMGWELTNSFDF